MKNNTKYLEIFRLEILTATRVLAILCGVGIFYLLLHVIQTQRPRPLDCRLICKNS